MFRRKKYPVLTTTTCGKLENTRQAMEVLTGKRVQFVEFDFNTCHGKVKVDREEKDIAIDFNHKGLIIWKFRDMNDWYDSFIVKETGEVKVICKENPYRRNGHIMWWIGKSYTERYESPLYRKELQRLADRHGVSLETYLRLETGEVLPFEADVFVGSTKLTSGQSMAVRVAVTSMINQLQDPNDQTNIGNIAVHYKKRLKEVETLLVQHMIQQ